VRGCLRDQQSALLREDHATYLKHVHTSTREIPRVRFRGGEAVLGPAVACAASAALQEQIPSRDGQVRSKVAAAQHAAAGLLVMVALGRRCTRGRRNTTSDRNAACDPGTQESKPANSDAVGDRM